MERQPTADEIIDRVRDAVDGLPLHERDVAIAALRAGLTLIGIALRRLDEDEREYRLSRLEDYVIDYLAVLAERDRRAKQLH